jgi:hypothetical protein
MLNDRATHVILLAEKKQLLESDSSLLKAQAPEPPPAFQGLRQPKISRASGHLSGPVGVGRVQ